MKLLLPLTASLLFAACGHDHDHDHGPDGHTHPAPAGGGDGGDGHTHAHGPRVPLGEVTVGGRTIAVSRLAEIQPGHEADFDLDFQKGPLPAAVRGWIGVESGQGSRKVRFEPETETRMHGHPEVPDPMPEGSKLWLELEGEDGTERASVALGG
ncbi:MAG: hypothetical protein AB7O97_12890 [Planctomycetota bacterium]